MYICGNLYQILVEYIDMKYAKQVCVSLLYCRSNLLDHLGETPQPSATQRERKCKSNVTDIPLRIYTIQL